MVSTQLPGIHNEDILLVIFSYLPTPDLARCAAVCKQWYELVTGSTQLWKGKRYTSKKSPRISSEMRAVLFALPLLQKAEVEEGPECYVNFSYPCLSLTVGDISDLRAVRDWQKMCPNVRELSICVDSLSADYLDALKWMIHLRTLKINSNSLEKLVFLRFCSEVLEELELVANFEVPSAAYVELRCLGNLRRLQLNHCRIEQGDLEVAASGMRSLESVELSNCDIWDLSFLRHCGQLREISIVVSYRWQTVSLPTGLGHLPASVRSLSLKGSAATPDELSEALPRLPSLDRLSLSCGKLDCLDFLRGCRQLRRLCLDYSRCPDKSQLLDLSHLSQLETLEMPGYGDDLPFLSSVIPSLPQLDTLSVVYRHHVDYVGLLQDFPRLHSLSLFDKNGNPRDISQLEKLDCSLYGGKYVVKFVREVV